MQNAETVLRKGYWVRVQQKTNRRVIEGFIVDVTGDSVVLGPSRYTPAGEEYKLSDLSVIKVQAGFTG